MVNKTFNKESEEMPIIRRTREVTKFGQKLEILDKQYKQVIRSWKNHAEWAYDHSVEITFMRVLNWLKKWKT